MPLQTPLTPTKIAALVTALVAVIVTGVLLFGKPEKPAIAELPPAPPVRTEPAVAAPDNPVRQCPGGLGGGFWADGDRRQYDYLQETEFATPGGATTRMSVAGTLNVRVFATREHIGFVGFQLAPARVRLNDVVNPPLTEVYGHTFFVAAITSEGLPASFFFPGNLSEQEQASLRELVYSLQVFVPPSDVLGSSTEWESDEQNGTGNYTAHYRRQADCAITKTKQAYTSVDSAGLGLAAAPLGLSARIVQTDYRFHIPNARATWIERLEGHEVIELIAGDQTLFNARTLVDLKSIPLAEDPQLAIWKQSADSLDRLLVEVASQGVLTGKPSEDAWEQTRLTQLRERYDAAPIGHTLNNLVSATETKQQHTDSIAAIHALCDHLTAFPDKALQIPALLPPDAQADVSARVVNALELAGTAQAQSALGQLIADPERLSEQRIQATVGAGGVAKPTEQTAQLLLETSAGESGALADTALLSLGSLASRMRPDQASAVLDTLWQHAEGAASDMEAVVALEALDNAAIPAPEILERLQPYLAASSTSVRANATRMLRHAPDELAYQALKVALDDPAPEVNSSATEVLEGLARSGESRAQGLIAERARSATNPRHLTQ
jgi:hypothetical protein